MSFLLNLEFLQAEFYVRATTGHGLDPAERGGSFAPCVGGAKVVFDNPLIEAVVHEFARVERQHIAFLRGVFAQFGEPFLPAPEIDLQRSFDEAMRASGLIHTTQFFDAFFNDTNLLIAAYLIEDVVVSAYRGALISVEGKALLDPLTGIMTAEAAQSGIIRAALLAAGLGDQTNAISHHRQKMTGVLGTPFNSNDHGVGDLSHAGVINTDGHSAFWPRSDRQVLNILFGGVNRRSGLFFPKGLSDACRELVLREVFLEHLPECDRADRAAVVRIAIVESERVNLPALAFGEAQLEAHDLKENVAHQPWSETAYVSRAPTTFEIADALSHGAVGILTIDDRVVHETLWHTDPTRHRYRREDGTVVLRCGKEEVIPGTTISILVGAAESYWHALLDSAARLLLIPDSVWDRVDTLLIPATGIRQEEIIELYKPPQHVSVRTVQPGETLRLERLIHPSSIHGLFDYNPTILNGIYDRLLANLPTPSGSSPRHVFIDRRRSDLRKLLNEDELVSSLPTFEPVRLETMSLVEQIGLFESAEIVIAPHGAGLTNIGFCRPGTLIIELMMDAYCNWCYRRIAAIRRLDYRCVLGTASESPDPSQSIHRRTWAVPIQDVLDLLAKEADASRSVP